jgi:hypothetical protein
MKTILKLFGPFSTLQILAYNVRITVVSPTFSADNVLNHMWVGQYEKRPGMVRDVFYGPSIYTLHTYTLAYDTAFKERVHDSRYSKTFQTVWYANNPQSLRVILFGQTRYQLGLLPMLFQDSRNLNLGIPPSICLALTQQMLKLLLPVIC